MEQAFAALQLTVDDSIFAGLPDNLKIQIFAMTPKPQRRAYCAKFINANARGNPCALVNAGLWQSYVINTYGLSNPTLVQNFIDSYGYIYDNNDWYKNFETIEEIMANRSHLDSPAYQQTRLVLETIPYGSKSVTIENSMVPPIINRATALINVTIQGKGRPGEYTVAESGESILSPGVRNTLPVRSLPEELGELPNLVQLTISNLPLTSLPESIGDLTKLVSLSMTATSLSSLPSSLHKLVNLKSLTLSRNNFTSIPHVIYTLPSLERLSINHEAISSLSPDIGKLSPRLRELYLDHNKINALPKEIGQLTSVEILDVTANNLTSLPDEVGNLSSLEVLIVDNNNLTSLPDSLIQLRRLNSIFAGGNANLQVSNPLRGKVTL
jgi:hypothetical protein